MTRHCPLWYYNNYTCIVNSGHSSRCWNIRLNGKTTYLQTISNILRDYNSQIHEQCKTSQLSTLKVSKMTMYQPFTNHLKHPSTCCLTLTSPVCNRSVWIMIHPRSLTQVFKITCESRISSIINSNHLSPTIIKSKMINSVRQSRIHSKLAAHWPCKSMPENSELPTRVRAG